MSSSTRMATHRMPFIARWSGEIAAGTSSAHRVSSAGMGLAKAYRRMIVLLAIGFPFHCANAHGTGPWGQALDWHNDQIDQVITQGYEGGGQKVSVEGKDCLAGGALYFKVNDEYAFDIGETVWLDLEFYLGPANAQLSVSYDRRDLGPASRSSKTLELSKHLSNPWYKYSVPLEQARFANLGFEGSDFSIVDPDPEKVLSKPRRAFTLCSIALRRSYTTPVFKVFGRADIDVIDEHGVSTPVRMGIYDASGALVLPGDEAITLKNSFNGASRVIPLGYRLPIWPVKNRSVFYTDGRYHSRLPIGKYELIVAKGPEYRLARHAFTVQGNETKLVRIKLQRWTDMATEGWYSGEDHIHYARNSEHDDRQLQLFAQAEDLRVANILQLDNSANTYLSHYDWKPVTVPDSKTPYVLVSGQEAPRTSFLGHTIQLNIRQPIRDPAQYLLYHQAFENTHAQGGLAGYAHVNAIQDRNNNLTRGMALDVPFGLVDFAEVISFHITDTAIWFDYLNLGYKISPTAGTDWPFGGVPGTVRNYVKIEKPFSPQAWFDELKQGHTFVTSGPLLDMCLNGQGMGTEIHVKRGEPLQINARAVLNPDIDALSSLELVEQGEAVKTVASPEGASQLTLNHDMPAQHGTWFVLRARGKNPDVTALSAPLYVLVEGDNFWKRSAVPEIVAKLKSKMQEILRPEPLEKTTEAYETQEIFSKYWESQRGLLKQRVDQANALYDDLVRRAAAGSPQPN